MSCEPASTRPGQVSEVVWKEPLHPSGLSHCVHLAELYTLHGSNLPGLAPMNPPSWADGGAGMDWKAKTALEMALPSPLPMAFTDRNQSFKAGSTVMVVWQTSQ